MNCHVHDYATAVATCSLGCGRGLCQDCTLDYDPPTCELCARREYNEAVAEIAGEMEAIKRQMLVNACVLGSIVLFPLLVQGMTANPEASSLFGLLMFPISIVLLVWSWHAFRWLVDALVEVTGVTFLFPINQMSCIAVIMGMITCISFAPIVVPILLILQWLQLKKLRDSV